MVMLLFSTLILWFNNEHVLWILFLRLLNSNAVVLFKDNHPLEFCNRRASISKHNDDT